MCSRVLVNCVVHLVVVRKVARAARKAMDMNVGHRLPGLLSVLANTHQLSYQYLRSGACPYCFACCGPMQHS